jgi:hypothetical protein
LINKIAVWSALEELWYGIPLRKALDRHKADLNKYYDSKRKKSLYIPAFDKNLTRREYELMVKFGLDLVKEGELELIEYE